MTPPAPTPEEVRAHAEDALDWLDTLDPQVKKLVIDDVKALVLTERATAHARGRAEGLEAAAQVADFSHQTTWPDDNDHWSGITPYRAAVSEAKSIAAAIRALKEKP